MPAPFPAPPICVIGDLHGRSDLLQAMLARIDLRDPAGRARCIFAGDLIDRGPDSATVLEIVHSLCRQNPSSWICLAGNHEWMMLEFLDDPAGSGPRWFSAGGEATLLSYGLSLPHRNTDEDLFTLAQALKQALSQNMIDWLRNLPLYWQEDHVVVAHAGADPSFPPEEQDAASLLWGRRKARRNRHGDKWIIQGHVSHSSPVVRGATIHVDTGAWSSGKLTAAWLEPGMTAPEWITVTDDQANLFRSRL